MPMQPRPMAETSSPPLPNLRVSIHTSRPARSAVPRILPRTRAHASRPPPAATMHIERPSNAGHTRGMAQVRKPAARPDPRTPLASTPPGGAEGARRWWVPAAIACTAAILLFWNLTDTYLWQDEANTAVLAVRLLHDGKPLAWDGRNLLSDDNYIAQEVQTIDVRTKDARSAVDDLIRRGVMTADGMWTYHPWGQFLLAGFSIALLGPTTFAARFPFAVAGLATVFALYWLALRFLRSPRIAALACALLTLNVYWILHSRQARYYSLTSLFLVLTLIAYGRWKPGARWGAATFVAVAWCWFQVDYGTV